jgi:hypothetical protein
MEDSKMGSSSSDIRLIMAAISGLTRKMLLEIDKSPLVQQLASLGEIVIDSPEEKRDRYEEVVEGLPEKEVKRLAVIELKREVGAVGEIILNAALTAREGLDASVWDINFNTSKTRLGERFGLWDPRYDSLYEKAKKGEGVAGEVATLIH